MIKLITLSLLAGLVLLWVTLHVAQAIAQAQIRQLTAIEQEGAQ